MDNEINELLQFILTKIQEILSHQFIGMYDLPPFLRTPFFEHHAAISNCIG